MRGRTELFSHPSWPRSTASHRAPGRLDTTLLRDSRVELGEADALPAELGGPALVVVQTHAQRPLQEALERADEEAAVLLCVCGWSAQGSQEQGVRRARAVSGGAPAPCERSARRGALRGPRHPRELRAAEGGRARVRAEGRLDPSQVRRSVPPPRHGLLLSTRWMRCATS